MRLVLSSWCNTHTGYGQHATEIVRHFLSKGIEVAVRPTVFSEKFTEVDPVVLPRIVLDVQPERYELLLSPPNVMPTAGKRTIYYTMWETTALHSWAVKNLNEAKLIIVPCEWNRTTFLASGVTAPIVVIPLGYDDNLFKPAPYYHRTVRTFGAAGRLQHGPKRKGVGDVITAFKKAFPDNPDVRLSIKLYPDCGQLDTGDPRIETIRQHLTWTEMAEWVQSLDFYVTLARGEGFGLLPLQALGCGVPVIAPFYGGLGEYLTEDCAYPVEHTEELASDGAYFSSGRWCRPSIECAAARMMQAYGEVAFKDEAAVARAKEFTWTKSCEKLEAVLRASSGALGAPTGSIIPSVAAA